VAGAFGQDCLIITHKGGFNMKKLLLCSVLVISMLAFLMPSVEQTPKAQEKVSWILQSTEATHEDFSTKACGEFAKRVAERTGGMFKIRVALAKELGIDRKEYPSALRKGEIEMAYLLGSVLQGFMPEQGIYSLPYLTVGQDDIMKVHAALKDVEAERMRALGFEPIAFWTWLPQDLISTRPIGDWIDLKGFKIRIWRDLDGELIKAMKGEPIYLSGSECYPGLQRGVVDGVITGPHGMLDRSLDEVAKHYYPLNLPSGGCYLGVNTSKLQALPENYKKVLLEEAKELEEGLKKNWESTLKEKVSLLNEKGVKLLEIPSEGRTGWQKAAGPIWDSWAKADSNNQKALGIAKKALDIK
jgi:TRAP-type C4-dicarboxylate transport system substrate-binding protein